MNTKNVDENGDWDELRTAELLRVIADDVEEVRDATGDDKHAVTMTPKMARWVAGCLERLRQIEELAKEVVLTSKVFYDAEPGSAIDRLSRALEGEE